MRGLTSAAEVAADGVGGNFRSQFPNPKQNLKSQNPKVCIQVLFEIWGLEFPWSLGFGIWDLPRSGPSQYRDSEIPQAKLFTASPIFVLPRKRLKKCGLGLC
jgi:hypothetical protein